MKTLGPKDLPVAGWTRIDVAKLWPTELLPLLEAQPGLQRALEAAMDRWCASLHPNYRPDRPWRWDDPACEPPCMIVRGDGLITEIDNRITAAAEVFDPEAMAYQALGVILYGDANLDLPEHVTWLLSKRETAIWRSFMPKRDEIVWVRPYGSCHWFVDFELALAKAWRPDVPWAVATSKWHSTVIALDERLIFDLVLLADERDTDPNEPVLFVRGSGKAVAEIKECARINRNAHARWERKAKKAGAGA